MALLNFFNASGAVGQPKQNNMTGLLNNPMLQIGLGILANNNTRNFGQNVGRGAMQGLNNLQQIQQQQQMQEFNEARMKQFDMLNKQQNERLQSEKTAQVNQQQAIDELVKANPELAPIARIDPKAALKMMYPQVGTPTEMRAVQTDKGWANYNPITGKLEPILGDDGKAYMPPQSDPNLQGQIAYSKAYGGAGGKLTDIIDGKVMTEQQAIDMTGGRPQMPQVPQFNRPQIPQINNAPPKSSGRGDPARIDTSDIPPVDSMGEPMLGMSEEGKRALASAGFGVQVPTKADQARSVEMAKLQAKDENEAVNNLSKVVDEGKTTMQLVDDLLSHKGLKGAVGLSSYNPLNKLAGTAENDFNIRLDQLQGKQFLQAFESLKGGGAITEVEGKKATDAIARMKTNASEEEFKKAANEFKSVIQKGIERAENKAGRIMPQNEKMPTKRSREDILKQYGVK